MKLALVSSGSTRHELPAVLQSHISPPRRKASCLSGRIDFSLPLIFHLANTSVRHAAVGIAVSSPSQSRPGIKVDEGTVVRRLTVPFRRERSWNECETEVGVKMEA